GVLGDQVDRPVLEPGEVGLAAAQVEPAVDLRPLGFQRLGVDLRDEGALREVRRTHPDGVARGGRWRTRPTTERPPGVAPSTRGQGEEPHGGDGRGRGPSDQVRLHRFAPAISVSGRSTGPDSVRAGSFFGSPGGRMRVLTERSPGETTARCTPARIASTARASTATSTAPAAIW